MEKRYKGDLDEEFEEIEEGISEGNIIFDVKESSYYEVEFFDGKWIYFPDL